MRNVGCYPDLSIEEYHADKNYISRSGLMDFAKTPFNYWAKHLNPYAPHKESTPAMILGSAFHTMILEPHLFYEKYDVLPPKVLLKDVGREKYDAFKKEEAEALAAGKIVLSDEEFSNLSNMEFSLKSNFDAMQLLADARIENSFFWQDKESGLFLKCRPDALHPNMVIDIKTTADASPKAFQRSIVDGGYHIQFAMIRDAVEEIEDNLIYNFINIVIETKYPWTTAIYLMDEEAVDEGRRKYKQLCWDLKASLEEKKFTGYGIQTITLPRWAYE